MRSCKVYMMTIVVQQATAPANGNKQAQCIVASRTKKDAAKAFDVSLYEFNNYAGQTGNEVACNLALASPGKVFYFDEYGDKTWHPLK